MGILRFLQQVTLPSIGMMCSNSQLISAHPFPNLFIFFSHHHMECFLFPDFRMLSPYIYSKYQDSPIFGCTEGHRNAPSSGVMGVKLLGGQPY